MIYFPLTLLPKKSYQELSVRWTHGDRTRSFSGTFKIIIEKIVYKRNLEYFIKKINQFPSCFSLLSCYLQWAMFFRKGKHLQTSQMLVVIL